MRPSRGQRPQKVELSSHAQWRNRSDHQDMCGRFVQKTPLGEIRVLFGAGNPVPNAPARYNAARPTPGGRALQPEDRERSLDLLRWACALGQGRLVAALHQCARDLADTRSATPSSGAAACAGRRFYGWQDAALCAPAPAGRALRSPAVARRNPQDGSILRSFTIVTGAPNELCQPIHDRMPVILPPAAWPLWLGEEDAGRKRALRPAAALSGRTDARLPDRARGRQRQERRARPP